MSRRKRLFIEDLDSVGGVDAGDNPGATLLFWKRRKADDTPDTGETVEGVLMDGETVAVAETEEEVGKSVEAVDEPVEVEVGKAGGGEVEGESEPHFDPEADEVAKREDVLKAERDAAIAALAEEVEKRETQEWVEKAKPFELLLGDPNTVGPALRSIHNMLPDTWAVLEPALKAANSREHLAKILGEIGGSREPATPFEQRDAYVKEMRKLHPDMTVAQARAQFWHEHPEAKQASRE